MELLEYQAKKLFREVGIPVLSSETIGDPRQLKQLKIPYPIVLKSQVRVGGRGRAGGIRFVENTIDAIAAARTIFHLPIVGEYPQVLLAEARYDADREFFLAVVLDYQLKLPVLLGSIHGGMDVEALLQNLQKVVVNDEFSPFYARRLAIKMGLTGKLIQTIGAIVEKMYHLFLDLDLDLIEINPLGISATGELMALDGKISVNDNALVKHPETIALIASDRFDEANKQQATKIAKAAPRKLEWGDEKGKIAIICNSFDLALTSWDLIHQEKGKPACLYLIGEENNEQLLTSSVLIEQLEGALDEIIEIRGLRTVLINILAAPEISTIIAETIANYLQPKELSIASSSIEDKEINSSDRLTISRRSLANVSDKRAIEPINLAIRLVGGEIELSKQQLASLPIYWTNRLEEAVNQAILFTKSK
ncbi:MAG: ATP-grasp domain-containing protein [Xenococcaceae cyanobacterium]